MGWLVLIWARLGLAGWVGSGLLSWVMWVALDGDLLGLLCLVGMYCVGLG